MTILVLGGKGQTATRLSCLLAASKVPFLVATRSPSSDIPHPQVRFDWLDEKSYPGLFNNYATNRPRNIKAIYLVAPPVLDMFPQMKALIDLARSNNVQRFVLLSASSLEPGGPAMGQIHQYIASLAVEYTVLRPSWFMQNLSDRHHRETIKGEGKIYSATGSGKIPWVSVNDIAAVAYRALVNEKSDNTDHLILGPELLSYDQISQILTEVLGEPVTHVSLTVEHLATRFVDFGIGKDYAQMLSGLDAGIAAGSEERMNEVVKTVTGHEPVDFRSFAESNRRKWEV